MPVKGLYVAKPGGFWWTGSIRGGLYAPGPFTMDTTRPTSAHTGLSVFGLTDDHLTVHTGDLVLDTNNVTIDGYLIYGLVSIGGSDVTLKNCKIISRKAATGNQFAAIESSGQRTVIENCEVTSYDDTQQPPVDNSTYVINGGIKVRSGSATIRRCDIHDYIDAVYINGGTVEVAGNYLHAPSFLDTDENQAGSNPSKWSHNDGVQVMGGTGHNIHGNNIDLRYSMVTGNPTVNPNQLHAHGMLMQGHGSKVTGVTIAKNWCAYGAICILFSGKVNGSTATMDENRFTPNQGKQFSQYQQMSNDPNTQWTVTGAASTVYSDDPDTPAAWRGEPIKDPVTYGTVDHWYFDQNNPTP